MNVLLNGNVFVRTERIKSDMKALTFGFEVEDVIAAGRIARHEVDELKKKLEEESVPKLSEQQIVLFLLSCERNIESSVETVKAYFETKNSHPDIFNNRDIDLPELVNFCTNVVNITVMPERSKSGCLVIFMRATDTASYSQIDCLAWLKIALMCFESGLHGEPPTGLIVIADFNTLGLMSLAKLKFSLISAVVHYLEMGHPLRLKAVHMINAQYLVTKFIAILKRFVKSDVMEKFYVHAPEVKLHEIFADEFGQAAIPKEYGGLLPDMATIQRDTIEELRKHRPYFEAEEAQRRD